MWTRWIFSDSITQRARYLYIDNSAGVMSITDELDASLVSLKGFDLFATDALTVGNPTGVCARLFYNQLASFGGSLYFNYGNNQNIIMASNGSTGRVLIGTDTDDGATRLQVNGNISSTTAVYTGDLATVYTILNGNELRSVNGPLYFNFNSGNSVIVCSDGIGNLLVGSHTDQASNYRLQVAGASLLWGFTTTDVKAELYISRSGTASASVGQGSSIQFMNATSVKGVILQASDDTFQLFNYNGSLWSERFRVAPTGNVIIGDTFDDGVTRLQVNGNISNTTLYTGNFGAGVYTVLNGNQLYSTGDDLHFNYSADRHVVICGASTGSLLVGNYTPDGINRLLVNGGAKVTGYLTIGNVGTGSAGCAEIQSVASSPVSSRLVFGTDNSGWMFAIGKNAGGTYTNLFFFHDSGNFLVSTTVNNLGVTAVNGYWRGIVVSGDGDTSNSCGYLMLGNKRTTPAANDCLGGILFVSQNGAGTEKRLGMILSYNEGTGGTNGLGGILTFCTKADNGAMAEAMRITSNGTVLVGTIDGTMTTAKMHVYGDLQVFGSNGYGSLKLGYNSCENLLYGDATGLHFKFTGTEKFALLAAGRMLIGATDNGVDALQVTGSILSSSTIKGTSGIFSGAIKGNGGQANLTASQDYTFSVISNTQFKILVRGSDSVVRAITLTLA